MDIKCNTNPYYFITPPQQMAINHRGMQKASRIVERISAGMNAGNKAGKFAGLCEDKFIKSPVASKSATGLLGFINKIKDSVVNYAKNYKNNIQHTYNHKVIFAIIEKKLFGSNSIDSLTHDLDKLVLYILGFPKSFVTKFHREHSVHHVESGKKSNLRSMLCDNIASSPEFKPEKKKSLREHYATCKSLQQIQGFKEILEKYNFGENLDFDSIKAEKEIRYQGCSGLIAGALNLLTFFYYNAKSSSL